MALEEVEFSDVVSAVIQTSRKYLELSEAMPKAAPATTPIADGDLASLSNRGGDSILITP